MLGFAEAFGGWVAVTATPAFVGLLVIVRAGAYIKARYLAAFAFGIFMWFFLDTIGGAANLDVDAGLTGGVDQVAIVLLFVIGLLFFVSVGGDLFGRGEPVDGRDGGGTEKAMVNFAIPLLVAIAVGIHGFGEGTAFGSTASTTPSTSLLDAFGGPTAGLAYVLHKVFEPMMVGACYAVYSRDRAKSAAGRLADIAALTVLFVVPSLIGAATGYFVGYDSTYLFALGTGTSVYAALRLAKPLFRSSDLHGSSEGTRMGISIVLGFLIIYGAALLHS
jgi:zinc transporter ZupT